MLDWLYEIIGSILAFLYSVVPNLGVAIILLTFFIMLLLYPLTAKQAKSMIAMQRVQPEIKKLQAKYKNDRQKLNEETMKFYQENKINPLSSCLPLLAQFPVFISLFQVLRNAYKWVPLDSQLFADLCRHGPDNVVAKSADACVKGKLDVNHLSFLGIDLQKAATDVSGGFIDAAPYFLLVLLVMATGFMQSRQAAKRTPAANKQMAVVMKVLPVFFGLISLQFPAGLVLYFFVSNLWRLGQQEVIFRRHGSAALPAAGKPGAIDVLSKERPSKAAPREVEAQNGGGSPRATEPVEEAEPPAQPSGRPARAAPATTKRSGGGLRGLFQLPPPDQSNGGNAQPAPGRTPGRTPTRASSSSGSPPKPPPQRKRRNKKKRKR